MDSIKSKHSYVFGGQNTTCQAVRGVSISVRLFITTSGLASHLFEGFPACTVRLCPFSDRKDYVVCDNALVWKSNPAIRRSVFLSTILLYQCMYLGIRLTESGYMYCVYGCPALPRSIHCGRLHYLVQRFRDHNLQSARASSRSLSTSPSPHQR